MSTLETTDLVLPLHALRPRDRAVAGSKATVLGTLCQAGIAVPEGRVLTTGATRLALAGLGDDASAEQVRAVVLPGAVDTALAELAGHFGDTVLAVRSSAAAEDLPEASYAGQYTTVLGVRGLPALRDAVRRCWSSGYDHRVRAYRHRGDGAPQMAVLVQRQLDADVAGVAFTANPVSGAVDEVLVSATPGLADRLVGGSEQPDEWVVRDSGATPVRVAHRALSASQAQTVARLALRVRATLGIPVDVEWVMADGRLLVVQARPITALPRRPVADLGPGTWVKDVEHYPEPVTAFGASLAAPWVAEGFTSMLTSWGGLLERMETGCIGGEAYLKPVPPGGHEGAPPPWWVLGVLVRVVPRLRRRMTTARRMMRPEVFAGLAETWETVWRPAQVASAKRLQTVDLAALDDHRLDSHLGDVVETAHKAIRCHFHLIPLYTVPPFQLVQVCREVLGWDEMAALTLLAGASTRSSEPTRALTALARRIVACPAARAAADEHGGDLSERLAAVDAGLSAAYDDWRRRYSFRCTSSDPGSPVFAERPWLLDGLLRDAVRTLGAPGAPEAEPAEARRARAVDRARTALAMRPARDRDRFETALQAALRYYPLREDTTFWLAQISGAGRLALLEAGRRLVARGDLDLAEDAACLDLPTLRAALTGTNTADLRSMVAQARSERAWVSRHPGPPTYGPPPQPMPDLRALPRAGRQLGAALAWAQPKAAVAVDHQSAVVTGAPASPGRHTGPVRIIRGTDDFGALRPGEVLVAPTTDPAWSVLFGIAGALVTDRGGVLCHAAIVAREHAIPAVVGTGNASAVLSDGELVTVDGATGQVLPAQT